MCTAGVGVDYLICVHVLGYAHLLQRTHVVVQRSILARLPGEGVTATLVIGGTTLRVGDSDCCGGGMPAAPPSPLTDGSAHAPMIGVWLSPSRASATACRRKLVRGTTKLDRKSTRLNSSHVDNSDAGLWLLRNKVQ